MLNQSMAYQRSAEHRAVRKI